ncbi:MAG: type IV pilin [Thermoplasmata archaeon]|nr:type IV pilin [Candidatus Sysuiplasma jiujiangense]
MAKRLKDSGVSPVIATILMVAITVVLAAVLYVMVSGFTHSPGTANSAGLTTTNNGAGSWTVTVDKVTVSNIALSGLKVVLNGTTYAYSSWNTHGNGNSVYLNFTNVATGSSDLSAGDYFSISSAGSALIQAGTTFEILDGSSILVSTTLQ